MKSKIKIILEDHWDRFVKIYNKMASMLEEVKRKIIL
jgi:hypothetical protein